VPKPLKLLESIGNGGNGAQRCCEQMINISYFYDPLESLGNHRGLSTCGFIFRAHAVAHRFTAQW